MTSVFGKNPLINMCQDAKQKQLENSYDSADGGICFPSIFDKSLSVNNNFFGNGEKEKNNFNIEF